MCLSNEALRASRVALVQLLAALGIEQSDIVLKLLRPDNVDVMGPFLPRSVTSKGEALLPLDLDHYQNRNDATPCLFGLQER